MAQRFNAGISTLRILSPAGTTEPASGFSKSGKLKQVIACYCKLLQGVPSGKKFISPCPRKKNFAALDLGYGQPSGARPSPVAVLRRMDQQAVVGGFRHIQPVHDLTLRNSTQPYANLGNTPSPRLFIGRVVGRHPAYRFKCFPAAFFRSCPVTPNHGQSRPVTQFSEKKDCLFLWQLSTRQFLHEPKFTSNLDSLFEPMLTFCNLFEPILTPSIFPAAMLAGTPRFRHKICVSSVRICGQNQKSLVKLNLWAARPFPTIPKL